MESPPPTPTRSRSMSVRFEDSCVLIPPSEHHFKLGLRPCLVRKSYSLPLWKTSPAKKILPPSTEIAAKTEVAVVKVDKDDKKSFSLTVAIPSLTSRSRPRPSCIPSPCLSKRSPVLSSPQSSEEDSSPSSSSALFRTRTLPTIQPAPASDAFTVPLRPCCEDCHSCVDAALAGGDHWHEKWSAGAMRRHSEGENAKLQALRIFGAIHEWKPAGADISLAAALHVDEVEAKHRRDRHDGETDSLPADENAVVDSDEEDTTPSMTPMSFRDENENPFFTSSLQSSPSLRPSVAPIISGNLYNLTSPSAVLDPNSTRAESPVFTSSPTEEIIPAASSDYSSSSPPADKHPDDATAGESSIHPDDSPAVASLPPPPPTPPPQFNESGRQRRLPFVRASSSFLRGSASVLKGVAAGMTSVSVGVVR